MPNVTLHFYAANDLNGDVLLELTDDDTFLKNIELKVAQSELGGGSFTLARDVGFPLFGSGDVDPDVLVRVLVHAYSDTDYFWGFFINKRAEVLVGEEGTEEFQFGGPGPKQYFERGGLGIEQYTGAGNWNIDLEAGVFRWNEDATAGRVLNRVIAEDAANPASGCPDATRSFTAALDSDGNAWTGLVTEEGADDFELPIGHSILKTLWELEDGADIESRVYLGTVADPVFRLDALPVIGTDYATAGTDYGASTLRFLEAHETDYPHGNIGSIGGKHSLTVEGESQRKPTHVNVKGKDGVWAVAVRPSWSPGDYVKWATIAYTRSSRTGFLELVGQRWLRRQDAKAEEITIPIIPGDDPLEGRYFPDPEGLLWIGNTAAIHTGPASGFSPVDYRNEQLRVTRIDLNLLEASVDTDSLTKAMSWQVEVSFNTERGGSQSPSQATTGRSTPNPLPAKPCRPALFEVFASVGSLGSNGDDSGTNHTAQVVTGPRAERVEMTTLIDAPLGHCILVAAGNGDDFNTALGVWDDAGNVYHKVAERRGTAGGSEPRASGWYTNVTSQLDAGEKIYYEVDVGASLSSTNERGSKTISAWLFEGSILSGAEDAEASNSNSSTPSITVGAADLQFVILDENGGATGFPDVITPDADWTALDGVSEGGTSPRSQLAAAFRLFDLSSEVWSPVIDQARNWAATSAVLHVASSADPRDGHPDLVGSAKRWNRCDSRHDVHRDVPPTVNDDWATKGYKLGTIWAQLDDLGTPTEIVGIWMAVDVSTGAAVWLELPGGGGGSHATDHEEGGGDELEVSDLATSETDTALVLHPDGTGGVEWGADATGGGGGSGIPSGTSFPGSPASDDLFYRTDHDLLYFYNGTLWLTVNEYQTDIFHHGGSGLTADANVIGFPIIADGDTYLTKLFGSTWVSATAIWNVNLIPLTTGLAGGTTIATLTTSGDAANTVVRKSATINALVPNTTFCMQVVFDETSGSATFIGAVSLRYRRRAT